MSATLSKLRTSWVGRALLAYAVSALALVVLGLAAPGSAVFFPLVSLWCNLALFGLVLVVLRLADVKFDLFHWAVIIGFWAAALLYFYWAETRRSFVYIWDYVNYINKQYNAEAAFLQGPAVGFHFILDSLAEDYTNFNTLFLEFPFCLTDRTGDSFAICQVFSIVPMLLLLLAGLVVKVGQMLQVKNRFWYFLIGLSWTFTYPWLRMSAVLSQPDWFGLIFAFSILLLTLDFRFEKLDLPRFGLLFLSTAAIILSRRWYLYFVVGYYFAYAVLVLVSSARIAKVGRKQEALLQVRNLILFGLMSMVAMVILLWPLVSHILGYDYADHYSYYNGGGMVTETYLQCARMGLMNLVLMGMGLWFCFKRRKMPALPCLAGLEILLSMVLFTRVQTTGSQHMLLFLPGWFLLFLIGAAALAEGMNRQLERLSTRRKDLDEAIGFCKLLQKDSGSLEELDVEQTLARLAAREEQGVTFVNIERTDRKGERIRGACIGAALFVALMAFVIATMAWAFYSDPQEAPPLPLLIVLFGIPVGCIVGTLKVLLERIEEIGKGEEDAYRNY